MKSFFFTIMSFLLFSLCTHAQVLKGKVVDSKTGEPVVSASVYIDGTSTGVITDFDGKFTLNYPETVKSALIVRILGYEPARFPKPLKANLNLVKLVQKADQLDAVILNPDPWSRKKKERYFKDYFLGTSSISNSCKILNLDKVRLRFNPATGLMTARCNEPILIENKHLGYLITYDLQDFELIFEKLILKSGPLITLPNNAATQESLRLKEAYYLGSSYFQELSDKPSKLKRYYKRRDKLYLVSDLRFFRVLSRNQLRENGYALYYEKFAVDNTKHIRVKQFVDFTSVSFRHKEYAVLDKDKNRTDIYLTGNKIIIDQYGNNLAGRDMKFSGFIANLRISGLLPLDYQMVNEE